MTYIMGPRYLRGGRLIKNLLRESLLTMPAQSYMKLVDTSTLAPDISRVFSTSLKFTALTAVASFPHSEV